MPDFQGTGPGEPSGGAAAPGEGAAAPLGALVPRPAPGTRRVTVFGDEVSRSAAGVLAVTDDGHGVVTIELRGNV